MEQPYYNGWWLPINISTHGAAIDRLIHTLHWFMAILFVGWFIYFVYCLIRFREKANPKATLTNSKHFKLPTYLEVGIVIVEAALLVFVSSPIWARVKNDFPGEEKNPLKIKIVAEQFAWNIHYPGRDGKFGRTKLELIDGTNPLGIDREDPAAVDDVFTINELIIPTNRPVVADLTSKDVIHSFALPVMRVKQDAVPGMNTPVWFEATQTGDFDVACAQLCGNSHYRMRGSFQVKTPEEFQTWLDEQHVAVLEEQGLPVENAGSESGEAAPAPAPDANTEVNENE